MTKVEFMKRLEACLQEVSYDERQSALSYYEEYFEEAGAEEDAVGNLESPEDIAKAIKEDLDIRMQTVRSNLQEKEKSAADKNNKRETEKGGASQMEREADGQTDREVTYQNDPFRNDGEMNGQKTKQSGWTAVSYGGGDNAIRIIIYVILGLAALSILSGIMRAIFGFPFWHTGIFGSLVGILVFMLFLTFAGYVMVVGGIVLFVTSIVTLAVSGPSGLFTMGISFLLIGLGILLILSTKWFWSTLVPKFFRMISNAFHGNRENGKGASA